MNTAEYNHCVDSHSDGLYRFILSHIRNTDTAQDIVQEAFVRLWEKRNGVKATKAKTYLFTTAYHCLIDRVRKDKKISYGEQHMQEAGYENHHQPDLQDILHQALQLLTPVQRSVVLLRDYEGYSYDEIGTICELSTAQVKVYIFRARSKMKTYLGNINKLL